MPPDHEQWVTRNLNIAVAFFNYLSSLENITLFLLNLQVQLSTSHPYLEASLKPLPLRPQIRPRYRLFGKRLTRLRASFITGPQIVHFIHDALREEPLITCIKTCCTTIVAPRPPVLEHLTLGCSWRPTNSRLMDLPATFMPWEEEVLLCFPICLQSIELRSMNLGRLLTRLG